MTQARSAAGSRTLETRYYTSESIHRLEMERIFSARWLPAGRAADIAAPSSYLTLTTGNEAVIVLRDDSGAVRGFHNVCRHRGTRLCVDASGTLPGSIRCPYHGWRYALDGRLMGAPNMNGVEGFDRKAYPLHPVQTATAAGECFVNLLPDPPSLVEFLSPVAARLEDWALQDLVVAHRLRYDVRANWKLIFQNYSECYHCPTLHPALNRLTPFRDASNDLTEGGILGGPMKLSGGAESMTMTGRRCAEPIGRVAGDALGLVYYYTIFPAMLLSLHPDYVLVHRIRPMAHDRTEILCDWLFHPDAVTAAGFDPAPAIEFWNTTNLQDWRISERSQLGIGSRAYTPGPYSNLESMVAAWDRQYLSALGAID